MSELQKLKDENVKLLKEIDRLKKSLEIANYWNDKNNIEKLSLRATQRGVIVEKQEREIQELKSEIQKLKIENEKLKSSNTICNRKIYNERGAGRKARFSSQEKEMMKMYRIQGKTIKELAEMYSCSVGLIHKIINE